MSKFESLCNEYRENKRLIEELQAMNDGLKADIIALMGNNDSMTEGAARANNILVQSSKFDSTAFKKVYPDLYTQYSKPNSYRRFTVV